MKKIVSLMLCFFLLIPAFLSSCGESEQSTEKASQSTSKSESKTESKTEKATETVAFDDSIDMVYVDPDFDGTPTGSNYEPFTFLEDAYAEAIRRINAGETESVTIALSDGTYLLSGEMLIDGSQFTVEDYAVSFVGEGAGSIVTPTVPIYGDEFVRVDGDYIYYYQLPEEAKDESGKYPAFRDLYINGKALTLARHYEELVMQIDSAAKAADNKTFNLKGSDQILYVRPDAVCDVATDEYGYFVETDAEGKVLLDGKGNPVRTTIEYCVKTEWQFHLVHADRIVGSLEGSADKATGEELMGIHIINADWTVFNGGYTGSLVNCSYWTQNSLDYLDSEGEFYYDQSNGIIYVYTAMKMEEKVISYPIAECVFHLNNVKNISIESLAMYGATMNYPTAHPFCCGQDGSPKQTGLGFLPYAGIYGYNVANITVYDCSITDVGNDGVFFCGAVDNVTVSSCMLENVGAAGVRIGQAQNTFNDKIHSKNITITDNYLYNIATTNPSAPAVKISSVMDLDLSYNSIIHCQYSGISIGYDWTERRNYSSATYDTETFANIKRANVSHNYLCEYMLGMSDGGAIYVLGGNATKNVKEYLNSLNNNVCVLTLESSSTGRGYCMSYYHDGGSSHWGDYDNMLIISTVAEPPMVAYIYFQLATGAWSYNNQTERTYIVGYPKDHKTGDTYPLDYDDPTNETIVGYYAVMGKDTTGNRKSEFSTTIDPETGAYTIIDPTINKQDDYVKDIYLYHDFDDPNITEESDAAMAMIYENSGSTLYTKPEYGTLPDY